MPDSPVLDLGFARLDLGREQRQGLAEVVYAPGKTRGQIDAIVRGLLAGNTGRVLVTRVGEGTAEAVRDLGDVARIERGRRRYPRPARSRHRPLDIKVFDLPGTDASRCRHRRNPSMAANANGREPLG